MKLKFPKAMVLAAVVVFSAAAQDSSEPPDEEKVSYALGMNLGLEIKRIGADVDVNTIIQAAKDVIEGKPAQIKESEARPIFEQELTYQRAVISKKNKAEGEAYLARNAKLPEVTVLADGLQYRVIKPGAGATPRIDDNIIMNSHGSLIDGKIIDQKDHYQISVAAQMKGFQEALQMMPTGSKWQIVLPPALAFGSDWKGNVGPDSTVIFEIELISIEPSARPNEGAFGSQTPHVLRQNQPASSVSNSIAPSPAGK